MEQFYCEPYRAKLSAAVCACRYRQVNARSPNPGKGVVPKFCKPCRVARRVVSNTNNRKASAPRPAIPPPAPEAKALTSGRAGDLVLVEVVEPDTLQRARKVLEFVGLKVVSWVQGPQGLVLQVHEARD
jgi:hypothetical protein